MDNPPHRLCGLDLQDYLASLDQFRLCPAFASLAPRPELLEWFQRNGDAFEHHVLTARPTRTVAAGSSWVFTHFGRWVRHFHFVPAARPDDLAPDSGAGKECLLRQIGCVDFMVDDSAGNLKACAPLVGRGILVPQPWNGGDHGITAVLGDLPVASH